MTEVSNKHKLWKSYRFLVILLCSIFLGSIIGLMMGTDATVFKPLGDLFINMMFTIVVPLVFTTISSSIASMSNIKRLGNILRTLLFVFVGTGTVAAILIIALVIIFPPAQGVQLNIPPAEALKTFNTGEQIVATFTVTDFPDLISKRHMLPLIDRKSVV